MAAQTSQSFLEVKNITKRYGHVEALRGVSLQANRGEILAIVGDNGAGKSTLIQALSGAIAPDSGSIVINGKNYAHLKPKTALAAGISTVYQDLALVNTLDSSENIFLGREHTRLGFLLAKNRMRQKAIELLQRLNINLPSYDMAVGYLSGGQRQSVAVARAVHQGGKLLIFDEPTAAMGLRESGATLALMQNLAAQGFGVIVISHNMQQVFQIAQRICVMRHGQVVAQLSTAEVTAENVVSLITGATVVS